MRPCANILLQNPRFEHSSTGVPGLQHCSSFLHLVSDAELRPLEEALARGHVPADFDAKLCRLEQGNLLHRSVARHCRCFIALLQAFSAGSFTEVEPEMCERLLRVLAYVRKDDDSIPDYRPDGFVDDQEEVRKANVEFQSLLQSFKAWRLRHQVPALWWS
jgi:hypothetical protein